MTLGIKVGPQPQSFLDLASTNPPFAEVWFNIGKKDVFYPELFAELKKRQMQVGLHFWGHVADGTWTNIGHTDTALVQESMRLMQETIDIAAQNNFQYVNIHPSNLAKCRIDFEKHRIEPYEDPIDAVIARQIFIEHAQILHQYATERGVLFTIETAPPKDTKNWLSADARRDPVNIYTLDASVLIDLAAQGLWIANDFGHTPCSIISEDRTAVWNYLHDTTHVLASQTRVLHLGYVVPPYNGTDFHDHLDNPQFDTDQAVPNKQEMIELLKLFKNRDDVWALVEPINDHPKNYHLAQELIDTIV